MTFSSELARSRLPQLERAHRRLLEKQLLTTTSDAVSTLLPGRARMLFRGRDDLEAQELALDGQSGTAALHGDAYLTRPDVGAVASASTATSADLWRRQLRVPIVFDEQARHIGEAWPNASEAEASAALAAGANAGVIAGRFLILGVTPSRMVYNAELFEKSAHAYLLARGEGAGRKTTLVPWWVRLVAGRRLRRDQRNAADCHRLGKEAPELVAY